MKYPDRYKGKYKIIKSALNGWYIKKRYNTWIGDLFFHIEETYYCGMGEINSDTKYFTSLALAKRYIDDEIKYDMKMNAPDEFIEFYP